MNMTRTNLVKQDKFKKTEKKSITKYILLTVAGVLAVSSIAMTVETAGSGAEVAALREEQNRLVSEKRNLENTLVKSLSLTDLEVKSAELGYAKPIDTVYISGNKENVAQLP